MLQRAMSVRPGQAVQPDFINSLLAENFAAMQRFGDPVLKPFLQVRLPPRMTSRMLRQVCNGWYADVWVVAWTAVQAVDAGHASSFWVCRWRAVCTGQQRPAYVAQ